MTNWLGKFLDSGAGGEAAMLEGQTEEQGSFLELLGEAARIRASDIHIAAQDQTGQCQFRVNGSLEPIRVSEVDRARAKAWITLAHRFCGNVVVSQGGAAQFPVGRISGRRPGVPESVHAIRVQFNPLHDVQAEFDPEHAGNQYMVMRMLYAEHVDDAELDIDSLGYGAWQVEMVRRMRCSPTGLVLISGSSSSGKSTTLQRNLQALLREKKHKINVIALENFPEYDIAGVRQFAALGGEPSSISEEDGFAPAIKGALWSAPDVIAIGEIRDRFSAKAGIDAFCTGHQVWAALNANSCVAVLDRLASFGVLIKDFASTDMLQGLIVQELVPELCPRCRISWDDGIKEDLIVRDLLGMADEEEKMERKRAMEAIFEEADRSDILRDRVKFRNPETNEKGCGHNGCHRGYVGRTVVAEVMASTEGFFKEYAKGEPGLEGRVERLLQGKENGMLIREHCLIKVYTGAVDPADMMSSVMSSSQLRNFTADRLIGILNIAGIE